MPKELMTQIAGEITVSQDPGATIRKWRELFGVSQTELAEFLKVTPSTISDYEGGRRKSPGILVVKRFVTALIDMDSSRGGKIIRPLSQPSQLEPAYYTKEFFSAMNGEDFRKLIEAEVVANESRLKEINIYGYSIVDSLRAIVEIPIHEYLKMYGKTPERAILFTNVDTGRSSMIAVRIGRFSTDMKASLVVLHGIKEVDPLAIKIAKIEKIPLLITNIPIERIKEAMKKFE